MPSNFTPNYQLNQWEADDRVLRVDFNEDNAKLDAAIKAQADGLAAEKKARGTALAAEADARKALAGQVTQKADQSALAAEASAREAADAALGQRAGFQLISRTALGEEKHTANLDLSGVKWNQWAEVCAWFRPVTTSSSYYYADIVTTTSGRLTTVPGKPFRIFLYPFFSAGNSIDGYFAPFETYSGLLPGHVYVSASFSSLTGLSFYPTENSVLFRSGSIFEIWGRK